MAVISKSDKASKLVPGSDFLELSVPKRQMNILTFGTPGTGKTSLATRFAPDPVVLINFDGRADHAVREAIDLGRRVEMMRVQIPASLNKRSDEECKKLGQEAVSKVIRNFEMAVQQSQKGNVRTIALDTGTEYAEILNLAITGKAIGVKGDYGKSKDLMNREFWRLFNLAREGNAHFIILARTKEVWIDNQPTGTFTYRGPSVMDEGADWSGHIRLRKGTKGKLKREFEIEITKSGLNIDQLGEVYKQGDWEGMDTSPFAYCCFMQYLNIGSDLEDWT
jgi:hypothetical protein